MDVLNKPHLELQHDMKLWWVHNEAIIASLYAYKLTGREVFKDWFKKLDEWTWKHFPDPEYGEWFAYLNRRGEPTHMLKGGTRRSNQSIPKETSPGCSLEGLMLKLKLQYFGLQ